MLFNINIIYVYGAIVSDSDSYNNNTQHLIV